MDSDISWYNEGPNHFRNRPSTSGTQRGRPPDAEPREEKPDIKNVIEEVCLVDDEDDAEEAVNSFHSSTRKNILLPFIGVEIQEEFKFLEAIRQFKMILEEKVEVLTLRKNLKEMLYKYLLFFGTNYKRIGILYKDQYLDVMEDILVLYCDVIKELFREQKKVKIIQEARRIKILLRDCLLKKMDRILHVLLKVRLAPEIEGYGLLWGDVYMYFLTKVPYKHADDDILRGFVAFQKFKTIRAKSEASMIDKLMLEIYKKSMEELKRIPCLGEILDKMKRDRLYSVRDMVTRYMRYYKEKRSRSERFETDDVDEDTDDANVNEMRRLDLSNSNFPSVPCPSSSDSPAARIFTDRRKGVRKTLFDLATESNSEVDRFSGEFTLFGDDVTKREAVEDPVVVLDDEDDDVIVVCDNLKTVITIDDDDEEPIEIQPTKSPPPGEGLSPDRILRPPESQSTARSVDDRPPPNIEQKVTSPPIPMDVDSSSLPDTSIYEESSVPDGMSPPEETPVTAEKTNVSVLKKGHQISSRQVIEVDNSLKITINSFPPKVSTPLIEKPATVEVNRNKSLRSPEKREKLVEKTQEKAFAANETAEDTPPIPSSLDERIAESSEDEQALKPEVFLPKTDAIVPSGSEENELPLETNTDTASVKVSQLAQPVAIRPKPNEVAEQGLIDSSSSDSSTSPIVKENVLPSSEVSSVHSPNPSECVNSPSFESIDDEEKDPSSNMETVTPTSTCETSLPVTAAGTSANSESILSLPGPPSFPDTSTLDKSSDLIEENTERDLSDKPEPSEDVAVQKSDHSPKRPRNYSNLTECFTKFGEELSVEDILTSHTEVLTALSTIDLVSSTENANDVIVVKCRPIEPLKDEESTETVAFAADDVLTPSSEAIALLVTYPGSSRQESQHFLMCDANLALTSVCDVAAPSVVAQSQTDPVDGRESLSGSQPYTPQSSPSTRIETVKQDMESGFGALDSCLNHCEADGHQISSNGPDTAPKKVPKIINPVTKRRKTSPDLSKNGDASKCAVEDFREDLSQSVTSAKRVTPQEVDKITQLPFKYSQQLWSDGSPPKAEKKVEKRLYEDKPSPAKFPQEKSHDSLHSLSQQTVSKPDTSLVNPADKTRPANFVEQKLDELYIKEYGQPDNRLSHSKTQSKKRESREVKIYAKDKPGRDLSQLKDRDLSLKSYKALIKGVAKRKASVLRDFENLKKVEVPPQPKNLSGKEPELEDNGYDHKELFNNGMEGPIGKPVRGTDVDDNFFWDTGDSDAAKDDPFSGTISVKPDSQLYRAKKDESAVGAAPPKNLVSNLKSSKPKGDNGSSDQKSPKKKVTFDSGLYVKLAPIDIESCQQELKRKLTHANELKKEQQKQMSLVQEMREKQQQFLQRDQILIQIYSQKSEPATSRRSSSFAKAKASLSPNSNVSSRDESHSIKGKVREQVHTVHRNGHKVTEKRKNRDFEPEFEISRKKIAPKLNSILKSVKVHPTSSKVIAIEGNGIGEAVAPSSPVKTTKSGRVSKKPRPDYDDLVRSRFNGAEG